MCKYRVWAPKRIYVRVGSPTAHWSVMHKFATSKSLVNDAISDTLVNETSMPTRRRNFEAADVDYEVYAIGGRNNDGLVYALVK